MSFIGFRCRRGRRRRFWRFCGRLPSVFAAAPQSALDPAILTSAAERIAAELPEFAAEKAKRLADELTKALTQTLNRPPSDTGKSGKADRDDETLSFRDKVTALELALENESPVEIKYYVASRDEWTRRIVDISDVYEEEGKWYLEGYCRLRRDHRVFRIDNIGSIRIRD